MSDSSKERDLREASRRPWTGACESISEITLGAMLRIADSLEVIQKPYTDLIRDNKELEQKNEWYKEQNQTLKKRISYLQNSNAGYKSVITRMKNGGYSHA